MHINTIPLVPSLLMLRPQLHEHVNRVEARVLCKRCRNRLKRLRKTFNRQLFPPANFDCEITQSFRNLRLRRTAASDNLPILQSVTDHAQRIVQRPVRFVNNVLRPAANYNGDSLRVLRIPHVDQLVLSNLDLLHQFRLAQRVLGEVLDARNNSGASSLRQLLHIATAHILRSRNAFLRQIVQCHIINALLAEQDIRARLFNLRNHVAQHFLFLLDEQSHLVRVVDVDFRVEFCLFDFQLCVQQGDLCSLNPFRHLGMGELLVHDNTLDEFCLLKALAMLLENLNQVDVCLCPTVNLLGHLLHRLYRNVGKLFLRNSDTLAVHGRHSNMLQGSIVLFQYWNGQFVQNLYSFLCGLHVAVHDDSRVDIAVQELLCTFQELA